MQFLQETYDASRTIFKNHKFLNINFCYFYYFGGKNIRKTKCFKGSMLKIRNPNKFINILKKEDNIKIYADTDIISICSLRILTVILTKEYIKHEIIFVEDDTDIINSNTYIYLEDYKYYPYEVRDTLHSESNIDPESIKSSVLDEENEQMFSSNKRIEYDDTRCKCTINNLNQLMSLYSLAKSLNIASSDILWSVIVCFSYYKYFIHLDKKADGDDSSSSTTEFDNEDICIECNKSFNNLYLDIKKNQKILVRKDIRFPLIYHSDLYSCLKNDIYFIGKHRLIYKKRKDLEEYKLKNYLASAGISIRISKEKYSNLEYSTKSYISKVVEKIDLFFRKIRNVEYSSIDIYFLMNYFSIRKEYIKAYMLLDSGNYHDISLKEGGPIQIHTFLASDKFVNYIFNMNLMIKNAILNNIKYKDIIMFRIKTNNINFKVFSMFIYNQLSIYCKLKNYDKFLLVLEEKDKQKHELSSVEKENRNKNTKLEDSCHGKLSKYVILYGFDIKLLKGTINGYKLIDKTIFYREILNK